MNRRDIALALALLAHGAAGQESRADQTVIERVRELASGSERDRLAAVLFLEDSRSTDIAAWETVFGYGENSQVRDDARHMARVVRASGRVGEPELRPFLRTQFDEFPGPWTDDYRHAMGVAVGFLPEPSFIGELVVHGSPMDCFAMALAKMLPDSPLGLPMPPTSAPPPAAAEGDTFSDRIVAALRWGAVVESPELPGFARGVLAGVWRDFEIGPPAGRHLHAAIDYFARSKAKAPADVRAVIAAQLRAEDPELAGLAARALARSEGAGDAEVEAIESAFLDASARIARVDQARALVALPGPRACDALLRMLDATKGDPAVLRTVLESLLAIAPKLPLTWQRTAAATVIRGLPLDEPAAQPPDVRAAAVALLTLADPEEFHARLPAFRLAAPWPVRAAAAAGLFSMPALDEEQFRIFAGDPDRRVRTALLEAFAAKPPRAGDGLSHALGVFFQRRSGKWSWAHVPRTSDPVELSALASAVGAGDSKRTWLFLAGLFGSRAPSREIPHHEVEALQSILDLVGSSDWEGREMVLRGYLRSPEISLRKRAKALLAKNGIEAREEPPHEEWAAARMLEACIARAEATLARPERTAVIETTKGPITITLFASDCPATVENFLKLANERFYEGILWHRVVPAFVAQAGCPRGDGWGGPGYTIRCEVNHRTYRRGSVGMALAGKDTGGSQFFICHRALPHLDGRYTLFGQVTEGMDVVDALTQEDWIIRVREP